MNEKIVINWVDNVLKLAEDGYDSSSVTKKEEIFMELVGVCDSFLKIFDCDCRYDFSKCEKRVYSFKVRNTMIDWILEVIDCVMEGLKVENNTNMNKWFKYIMGVCKTIYMVFGYTPAENQEVKKIGIQDNDNIEEKRKEIYFKILEFWGKKKHITNEIVIYVERLCRNDTIVQMQSGEFFHSLSGKDFDNVEQCIYDYVQCVDSKSLYSDVSLICIEKTRQTIQTITKEEL